MTAPLPITLPPGEAVFRWAMLASAKQLIGRPKHGDQCMIARYLRAEGGVKRGVDFRVQPYDDRVEGAPAIHYVHFASPYAKRHPGERWPRIREEGTLFLPYDLAQLGRWFDHLFLHFPFVTGRDFRAVVIRRYPRSEVVLRLAAMAATKGITDERIDTDTRRESGADQSTAQGDRQTE